jgi:hypothetical protein
VYCNIPYHYQVWDSHDWVWFRIPYSVSVFRIHSFGPGSVFRIPYSVFRMERREKPAGRRADSTVEWSTAARDGEPAAADLSPENLLIAATASSLLPPAPDSVTERVDMQEWFRIPYSYPYLKP